MKANEMHYFSYLIKYATFFEQVHCTSSGESQLCINAIGISRSLSLRVCLREQNCIQDFQMVLWMARIWIESNREVIVSYYEVRYTYFLQGFSKTTKNNIQVIRRKNRGFFLKQGCKRVWKTRCKYIQV